MWQRKTTLLTILLTTATLAVLLLILRPKTLLQHLWVPASLAAVVVLLTAASARLARALLPRANPHPPWWAAPVAGVILPIPPAGFILGVVYEAWATIPAACVAGAFGGFAYWALSEAEPLGVRLRRRLGRATAGLTLLACAWLCLWWAPRPPIPSAAEVKKTMETVRAMSVAEVQIHRKRQEACAYSADTLFDLAKGVDVHVPEPGCGWAARDQDLAAKVGGAVWSRDKDPAHWDLVDGDLYTEVMRPSYSLAGTRALVHVNLNTGHAECYFLRTPKGWRPQSCETWLS